MADKTIVLTGSTGAFGKFLALEFLKHDDVKLVLPVRGSSIEGARSRVEEILSIGSGAVEVFQADLAKENLGLSKKEYLSLCERTTHILHSAASTRFNLSLEEARLHNVKTTETVLHFAEKSPNLLRFGFVSTALVAGKRTGVIKEAEFEHNDGFTNTYQQTKYEAEMLVRKNCRRLPVVIFRPPLIYTPQQQERSRNLTNFLYVLISLVAQGRLPFVPGTMESTMDIVDAKDAASIVAALTIKNNLSHLTYQIANGERNVTVGMLHSMIEEKLGKKVLIEYCGSMEFFLDRIRKISNLEPKIQAAYKRTASFLSEPAYPKTFDNANTLSELGIDSIGKDPIKILQLAVNDALWNY